MAEPGRKAKRSRSDLTDEESARIEPLWPKPSRRGRKPAVALREVLNAIRNMARSAGGWRMLPVHFGPWQRAYGWFRRFVPRLLFRTIHDVAPMLDREAAGREASPMGSVLDSQTVKAPLAELRGYDAGKRIVGRKRHVAVGGAERVARQRCSSGRRRSLCSPPIQGGWGVARAEALGADQFAERAEGAVAARGARAAL